MFVRARALARARVCVWMDGGGGGGDNAIDNLQNINARIDIIQSYTARYWTTSSGELYQSLYCKDNPHLGKRRCELLA